MFGIENKLIQSGQNIDSSKEKNQKNSKGEKRKHRSHSRSKSRSPEHKNKRLNGGWCRRSQPRVVIWFCIVVAESGLPLSSNNRTPDLRSSDHFFRIYLLDRGRPLSNGVLKGSPAVSSFSHSR
ncbi:hypothetical protein TNCV_1067601 [Trichonephila clavipes]|nr:hypothetical protein TNCV_1067601 [Trichonephila clavipes]